MAYLISALHPNRWVIDPQRAHSYAILGVIVAVFAYVALTVPNFTSASNISAILFSTAAIGTAAAGMAMIALSGNLFILSMGATAGLSSIIFAYLLSYGMVAAIIIPTLFGVFIGLLQGIAVGVFRCNSIITSIAVGSIVVSAGIYVSSGQTILAKGDASWLGTGHILPGVPNQAVLFLVIVVVLGIVVERTRFGRELRLTGTNLAAAKIAGLRTDTAVVVAYAIAGFCAALAGVFLAAPSGSGNVTFGGNLDFSAIAAILVGGVAIDGGKGKISDAAVGAFLMALIANVLLVKGFSVYMQTVSQGVVVLGSVVASVLLTKGFSRA